LAVNIPRDLNRRSTAKKLREEIVGALIESKGRVGDPEGVAARLRVNRTTLISRMKKLGIDPRQFARMELLAMRPFEASRSPDGEASAPLKRSTPAPGTTALKPSGV